MIEVSRTTVLASPSEEVWAQAMTIEGVNYELRPLLRMTVPRRLRGMTIDSAPVGERLGRSWILLLGFLPVDYDDLCLAERGPGFRFLERSSLCSMRIWQHEREIAPDGPPDGQGVERCRITDTLTFEPRRPVAWIPGAERVAAAVVSRLFARRHRRLAARYGGAG